MSGLIVWYLEFPTYSNISTWPARGGRNERRLAHPSYKPTASWTKSKDSSESKEGRRAVVKSKGINEGEKSTEAREWCHGLHSGRAGQQPIPRCERRIADEIDEIHKDMNLWKNPQLCPGRDRTWKAAQYKHHNHLKS